MKIIQCLPLWLAVSGAFVVCISMDALAQGAWTSTDDLANATYVGIYDHPVTLTAGRWEGEPFVAGGAARPTAGLVEDFVLVGDLDGDGSDETAVLVWQSGAGSGTYSYLAVMGRRDESVVNLGTAPVGDRVQLRAGRIVSGRIQLDVVQQGPNDAACCPTQTVTRSWELATAVLTENTPGEAGTLSLADLAGREWLLARLSRDEAAPAQPEITLVFNDRRMGGSSGCNRYFGSAQAGETPGQMSVSQFGTTRMACPETIAALETRFLAVLGQVARYSFLGGKLVLGSAQGGAMTTLMFTPRDLPE